jgi:hypothetical protein
VRATILGKTIVLNGSGSFYRKTLTNRPFTETPFDRTPFDSKVILPKNSFDRMKFVPKGRFTEKN